jgi:hypothetical protein
MFTWGKGRKDRTPALSSLKAQQILKRSWKNMEKKSELKLSVLPRWFEVAHQGTDQLIVAVEKDEVTAGEGHRKKQ